MYKNNIIKAKKLKKKYKNILKEIEFIGITGTNGKTTVTTLIYKYYKYINEKITLIGTNGIYINNDYYETINTTPGIEKLYEIILESYNRGIRVIVMEVSSHAITQNRIYGIDFKIKALTNITQDHIDYHKTFENYKKTKISFMKKAILLINNEIKINKLFLFNKVYKFGKKNSYFNMDDIEINNENIKFKLTIKNKSYLIKSNLLGEFNCYNVLLFIAVIYKLNKFDYFTILKFLETKIKIDGRMELFNYNNKTIIVDYAHTPDGMEKVLQFMNNNHNNKILTIFGCGGDRDKDKREVMGKIASIYSDYVIITSDNPRNENETLIIKDIIKGIEDDNYIIESNRKNAIDLGFKLLDTYDVLLILGRGNEDYIKVKDNLIKFNDIEYVKGKIECNG